MKIRPEDIWVGDGTPLAEGEYDVFSVPDDGGSPEHGMTVTAIDLEAKTVTFQVKGVKSGGKKRRAGR